MAISRIRGEQIRHGILVNEHVAANAGIDETKLSVNWSGHYQNALETKKVIDFVQITNQFVGGALELNLSTGETPILAGTATKAISAGTTEGVITDAPYNEVVVRDAVTGEPVLDANGKEVFGRLIHDGVDFKILFFSTDELNAEVPFTMPADLSVDMQYMERFNLKTVSELFAANEKFVAGSADATAHLNIEQLAKDLYGAGYTLDRDGQGNLSVNIVKQIADEAEARDLADQAIIDDLATQATAGKGANLIGIEDASNLFLGGTVEAVLTEIMNAVNAFKSDLSSQALGKGASLVGVHDADGLFTATTVEEVLKELANRATSLEQGSNAEVDNAKSRDAASANGYFAERSGSNGTTEFTSLEERLVNIETVVDAEAKDKEDRTDALEAEVEAARGSESSVDVRLDRALNENGTLKAGTQIHSHFRARYQATGGEAEVLLSAFNKAGLPNFQVGDDSLEVFINGQLQEPGLNYQEGANGEKIIFDLGDGTVLDPTDIVQIKYYINNAE